MAESGGSTFLNPELKINLAAIKKCDKFVVNILENASQVALYKFKSDTQAWVSVCWQNIAHFKSIEIILLSLQLSPYCRK